MPAACASLRSLGSPSAISDSIPAAPRFAAKATRSASSPSAAPPSRHSKQYLREGRPHLDRISTVRKKRPHTWRPFETVPLSARHAAHTPVDLVARQALQPLHQPSRPAPQLRHAHGRARSRPAQRANDARPRRHLHHAGLHASGSRSPQGRASHASSARRAPPSRRRHRRRSTSAPRLGPQLVPSRNPSEETS